MSLVFITYIAFLLAMVTHELGHLYFLKKFNVPVQKFSIGLGPILFKTKKITFRLFPLHGFVKYNEQVFNLLSSRQKVKMMLAGSVVNLLIFLSIVIFQITVTGYSQTLIIVAIPFLAGSLNLVPFIRNSDGYLIKKLILT